MRPVVPWNDSGTHRPNCSAFANVPLQDEFGTSLCYLDDSRALACSINGRIVAVDTQSMRVVDELAIEDHEPRPIEEYYPRVAGDDDKSVCSDITYFKGAGDYLIVVHPLRRPIEPGPDRMLCFRVGYVLERYAA